MQNPILGQVHKARADVLSHQFPELTTASSGKIQSLWKYVEARPQRFFSVFAYKLYLKELSRIDANENSRLQALLRDEITSFENVFRHIGEINELSWHDDPMQGEDDYRKLILIDQVLNPAYLRLTEAVLKPLLMLPAYFSRLERDKGTEKLELYDISNELADTGFKELLRPYDALVRNGIAHGGVAYRGNSILYRDKKGNSKELRDTEVIQLFDDLLDVCNGLVAALSVFLLGQKDLEYPRPQNLRIEELRAETDTPYWKVIGWLSSTQVNGSQLIVYVEVEAIDYYKVLFSSLQTAVLTESIAPGYDRYFLSISQPNGLRGFGAFDGEKLANHREQGHEIELYTDVLEDTGLFFVPRIKLPRVISKLGSLWLALRIHGPLISNQIRKNIGRSKVVVRRAEIHRNAWGVVLNAYVVLDCEGELVEQAHVRRQCKKIIGRALREARREKPCYSILRHLPLGYARVHLFQRDYRRRRLVNFGLGEDLVGTVQIKRIRRIRAPDIFGSTIEKCGRVRIAWNHRWLEKANQSLL